MSAAQWRRAMNSGASRSTARWATAPAEPARRTVEAPRVGPAVLASLRQIRLYHVVVLAAGQGTRMKSRLPKVLHPLVGRPLIEHVLRASDAISREPNGC